MKAYRVSDEDWGIIYLVERRARHHVNYAKDTFDIDLALNEIDIDRIANQRVRVKGDLICYQFSRTTNGRRTVRRTVKNLRQLDDKIIGEIEILGRRVKAERQYNDYWDGVEFIGWID